MCLAAAKGRVKIVAPSRHMYLDGKPITRRYGELCNLDVPKPCWLKNQFAESFVSLKTYSFSGNHSIGITVHELQCRKTSS